MTSKSGQEASSMSAEQRLKVLNLNLPGPPEPFGTYAEAVQTGNLLFLSGMLPTEGPAAKFVGRVGAELDVEAGRNAARLAMMNALAVARQHLGDRHGRPHDLGVDLAFPDPARDQLRVLGTEVNDENGVRRVTAAPLG